MRSRALFVLLALTLVPMPAASAPRAAVSSAPVAALASSVPSDPLVGLVGALAWPLVALLIAALFRKPLGVFLSTIGGRITKLSLFKVELELAPSKGAAETPVLVDDIRGAASGSALGDSSRMTLDQLQLTTPADFTLIRLGAGMEWLTSRLYISAILMERMRGVGSFVFVVREGGSEMHFVAAVKPSILRWALAQREPWLESAWQWARNQPPTMILDPRTPSLFPAIRSDSGALDPPLARQYARNFIDALQRPAPQPAAQPSPVTAGSAPGIASPTVMMPPPPPEEGWVRLETRDERAQWVNRMMLETILPTAAFDAWTSALRDGSPAARARAVLRRPGDFVAMLDEEKRFQRIVNRRALLEIAAEPLAQEPDAK